MSAISNTVTSSNRAVVEFSQPLSRTVIAEPAVALTQNVSAATTSAANTTIGDPQRDFVRVSSSIGRAASSGQLSRQEAVDIYRQIASLL